jgi:hypothetical protein
MKIVFYNIVKNTLPLLINTNITYDEYVSNLTTSSKRFLNLSYRKYNSQIKVIVEPNITKSDLLYITKEGKSGLLDLLLSNYKSEHKGHYFVKYYKEQELISFNHVSLTKSFHVSGYCNCFVIFSKLYKDKLFNTFSWFKFIEMSIKMNLADVLDLVVDRELFDYEKIENGKIYDIDQIENSKKYLDKRDKTVRGFNNQNSSKFLFLTKKDKTKEDSIISVVCACGQKTLLNIHNSENTCFLCKRTLSKIL